VIDLRWGGPPIGPDPDDLAAFICASLLAVGIEPEVSFHFTTKGADAIEIRGEVGEHFEPTFFASIPIQTVDMDGDIAVSLAEQIEALGRQRTEKP
jgi:hypothetical protein